MTSRREAVRRVLVRSDSFRSAQDIYAVMRAEGAKIGLTTVYRALQALSENDQVDVLRTGDGETVYRACTDRDAPSSPGLPRVRADHRGSGTRGRAMGRSSRPRARIQ